VGFLSNIKAEFKAQYWVKVLEMVWLIEVPAGAHGKVKSLGVLIEPPMEAARGWGADSR
jgi:hypothetical protein